MPIVDVASVLATKLRSSNIIENMMFGRISTNVGMGACSERPSLLKTAAAITMPFACESLVRTHDEHKKHIFLVVAVTDLVCVNHISDASAKVAFSVSAKRLCARS